MRRVVNPIVVRLGLAPTLTVRGRRSGEPRTVPFGGPFECDGVRYLVSGRGETDWVRNLRAAGGGELRLGRRRESFTAVEVDAAERERVLAAYRERFPGARAHFVAIPDPARHPVFRIAPG